MPNLFPNNTTALVPDKERRSFKAFDLRARAQDGGLWINVPHSLVQALFHLEYSMLLDSDLDTLTAHYRANRSGFFTYFESTPRSITDLTIGTGNGSGGQVITLPAKATTGLSIKVAGSPSAAWTLSVGTGTDGEDVITSTGGGFTNGAALTMSAITARMRRILFYASLQIDEDPVEANVYQVAIDLEEKLP